jgi:HNH endonuclease
MTVHYPLVARRARHRCEYCHAPESVFNFPFEVEHIIPVSKQGTDDEGNLALACRSCNVHKSGHLTGEADDPAEVAALFHPRRDLWEDHLRLDASTGIIHGLTAVGRGTASRLRFNTESQLAARCLWIRLGLLS